MKKILFLLVNAGGLLLVNAQKVEFGLQAGVCNYWGDLAPKVKLKETRGTGGIFARINFNHSWAVKTEYNHYLVTGTDKNFDFNNARNLSFRSGINEFSAVLEFNYLKYGPFVLHKKMTSYVYCGIAGFSFNPEAKLGDIYYDLHDYQTENKLYSRFAMAIPFGIGFKYMYSKKFAFETQLGFRRTYTDYLDDVSTVYPDVHTDGGIKAILTDRSVELYGTPQNKVGYRRGNPNYNDWYMSCTIAVVMRIHAREKCPRFF